MGDTGVGKSGLARVLAGQRWMPTESTHGRRIWTLGANVTMSDGNRPCTREIFLWDLAGQPDYRLIHQLSLDDVAVALVVFDAHNYLDPFSGVRYWNRALRNAGNSRNWTHGTIKILIAARADVGPSDAEAEADIALWRDWGFEHYLETSSKEGWGIDQLRVLIDQSISWELLPTVTSSNLFQEIIEFVSVERTSSRVLSSVEDLYASYRSRSPAPKIEDLRLEFETSIGSAEARGFLRRLSFGGLVLLQPELLDAYASAIVNAAKAHPEGTGSILEEDVRSAQFRIGKDERAVRGDHEKLAKHI